MKTLILALALIATLPARAAGLQGEIEFSAAEKTAHRDSLQVTLQEASSCLQEDLDRHNTFYRKWGISPFYGDQSSFSRLKQSEKQAYLRRLNLPDSLLGELAPTSCIGLTLKCLERGFKAAGQEKIWARLKAFTKLNGTTGNALQHGLQQLGWKVLYWNPDVSMNATWDARERQQYPNNPKHIWGNHAAHWAAVQRTGKYLYNRVDDRKALVNFGAEVPALMKQVPFFVGIAHAGYHVFPGHYGQVIEGHSTRQLTDSQTVESSPFSPLEDGGGPRGIYRSGLMAIPPGYLP